MNNTVSWRHCFRDFLVMPIETTLELVQVGMVTVGIPRCIPVPLTQPIVNLHESSLSTWLSLTLVFELGGSCTVCCSHVNSGQLYSRVWLALS